MKNLLLLVRSATSKDRRALQRSIEKAVSRGNYDLDDGGGYFLIPNIPTIRSIAVAMDEGVSPAKNTPSM